MAAFSLGFFQSKADDLSEQLLERAQRGSEEDVQRAVAGLVLRAERSADPDHWNAAGLALNYAGFGDRASQVFEALVRNHPDVDVYRLNLATSYSQTEQIELCRHHLRHVAEHSSSEQFRQIARKQLEGYERFVGLTERDIKLRELQLKSLRRAVDGSKPRLDEFIALATLLIRKSKLEPASNSLDEARSALERARVAFPEEPRVLELLVAVYLRHDPEQRLTDTLRHFQKIAPDSPLLELLKRQDEQEAASFSRNLYERAHRLMEQAIERRNEPEGQAALQELARIVAMYPGNTGYREAYAFALMGVGQKNIALEQARLLATVASESHSFHFNLGQIFWICGDPGSGERHLDLAFRYAGNEQERSDVRKRIAELNEPS